MILDGLGTHPFEVVLRGLEILMCRVPGSGPWMSAVKEKMDRERGPGAFVAYLRQLDEAKKPARVIA